MPIICRQVHRAKQLAISENASAIRARMCGFKATGYSSVHAVIGAKPLTAAAEIRSSDFMIIPSNNADPRQISRDTVVPVKQIRLQTMPFVSTFALGTGAGFYSSVRGPVPWICAGVPAQGCEAVM